MNLSIPIIAMTAHSLVGEQQLCFDVGMDAYVPKPFKQPVLLEAIKTVLTKEGKAEPKRKVNLSFLEEMAGEDTAFIKEMIQLFIERIPNEAAQLEKAFHNNDNESVKNIAHNMKSSLEIFMLKDLSNYLTIIEEEAKSGSFSTDTADKINFLHPEIIDVVKILKAVLLKI